VSADVFVAVGGSVVDVLGGDVDDGADAAHLRRSGPLKRRVALAQCFQANWRRRFQCLEHAFRPSDSARGGATKTMFSETSEEMPAEGGGVFVGAHFFDADHGLVLQQNWTCCDEASTQKISVLATSDDGRTLRTVYELRDAASSWQATQMFFVSNSTGYVLGDNMVKGTGVLLKTADAGQTWSLTEFHDVAMLLSAWHCSEDLLFINTESVFHDSNLYRCARHGANMNERPNGMSSSN
jgi:photosystem II stability/assembly factor-like uncharacterized protein